MRSHLPVHATALGATKPATSTIENVQPLSLKGAHVRAPMWLRRMRWHVVGSCLFWAASGGISYPRLDALPEHDRPRHGFDAATRRVTSWVSHEISAQQAHDTEQCARLPSSNWLRPTAWQGKLYCLPPPQQRLASGYPRQADPQALRGLTLYWKQLGWLGLGHRRSHLREAWLARLRTQEVA